MPQRGHQGIDRWPLYSQSRSWQVFRKPQMYEMFVSVIVK